MENHQLDCRGLNCPMPIVRVSQAMNKLAEGEVLAVQADDPAFRADIEAWAQMTGHQILSIEDGQVTLARLKRCA
jgi:tRNA 2-thiouridine synthesizing protein A